MIEIDCRGYSYPVPIVKTRNALRIYSDTLSIIVDDFETERSIVEFAEHSGCITDVTQTSKNEWFIVVTKTGK